MSSQTSPSSDPHVDPPRLPVPDLQETVKRYLTRLKPFLLEDEQRGGPAFQNANALRRKWAHEFLETVGPTLQARLQALDEISPNNWLDDNIWLRGYHQWRVPLLVNSNWWAAGTHDPTVPKDVLSGAAGERDLWGTGITRWQIRRTAWLAYQEAELYSRVHRGGEAFAGSSQEAQWFREMYGRIHNTSRIARPGRDEMAPKPGIAELPSRSILVLIHDWFYLLEVLDDHILPIEPKMIESRLRQVVYDVASRMKSGHSAVPLSVLSADDRDTWAENLNHLLSLSPKNQRTLTAINNSLLVFSLDHYTYGLPSATSPDANEPFFFLDSPEEIDAHLHNVRSSHPKQPGRNRWHDKTFTVVMENNSRVGLYGEHSPLDAIVPSRVAQLALSVPIDERAFGGPPTAQVQPLEEPTGGWSRLDWIVDDRIREDCIEAEKRAKEIMQDSDASALHYDGDGKDFIRQQGLSVDGYVQMALQLAYYKARKCFTATYEAALMSKFKNGRTETIRTLCAESREWVLSMTNPAMTNTARYHLLRKALDAHSESAQMAVTGRGIDRHLLGLRCAISPEDGDMPALMTDDLFMRSQTWTLSTSGLGTMTTCRGAGFGALEKDGYGVNYIFNAEKLIFGIESKFSSPETSTKAFKAALCDALLDMQQLCLSAPPAAQTNVSARL